MFPSRSAYRSSRWWRKTTFQRRKSRNISEEPSNSPGQRAQAFNKRRTSHTPIRNNARHQFGRSNIKRRIQSLHIPWRNPPPSNIEDLSLVSFFDHNHRRIRRHVDRGNWGSDVERDAVKLRGQSNRQSANLVRHMTSLQYSISTNKNLSHHTSYHV